MPASKGLQRMCIGKTSALVLILNVSRLLTRWGQCTSAVTVGGPSVIAPVLHIIRDFTLRRNHVNVGCVGKPSGGTQTGHGMRKFTLAGNLTSAVYVAKLSSACLPTICTRKPMLIRTFWNLVSARKPLPMAQGLNIICKTKAGRSSLTAASVGNPSTVSRMFFSIKGSTPRRNPTNVPNVGKPLGGGPTFLVI